MIKKILNFILNTVRRDRVDSYVALPFGFSSEIRDDLLRDFEEIEESLDGQV